jgi:hypothetical protein
MSIQKVLELGKQKEVNFRASYTRMGNKLIIIVPKKYHEDIEQMDKPVEVIVKEIE